MSDTPKTDKLAKREFVPDGVWIRHARELERENAALRSLVQHWYKLVPENIRSSIEDAQKEAKP